MLTQNNEKRARLPLIQHPTVKRGAWIYRNWGPLNSIGQTVGLKGRRKRPELWPVLSVPHLIQSGLMITRDCLCKHRHPANDVDDVPP